MKVLIAPDKFKGSLSALEVCKAIGKGLSQNNSSLEVLFHPMADGGDGSLDAIAAHLSLEKKELKTLDPLGRSMVTTYSTSREVAFIELANASGLVLLKNKERDPLKTSTIGTGKLIADALSRNFKQIYLFLGGSATNDGGMGIASALGFQFLDSNGKILYPNGENLIKVHSISNQALFNFNKVNITLLCDVNNPLYGKNGAAHIYAAQKGASPQEIETLDQGLKHFSKILQNYTGKDIGQIPGTGAAGGVGACLVGLCGATLVPGFDTISSLTQLEDKIQEVDWVISGEGQLDDQSLQGKVIGGIAHLCKKYDRPLSLIVGNNSLDTTSNYSLGIHSLFSIMDHAENLEDAMKNGKSYLEKLSTKLARRLRLG